MRCVTTVKTAWLRCGLASALACCVGFVYAQASAQVNTPQQAPDLTLLVTHTAVANGVDGIKRTSEFSERITRSTGNVWIARVLPAAAHAEHAHGKAGGKLEKDHKHLDVSTASRWLARDATGALQMRLVPNDEKVIVQVSQTDYGNIGFDGSWSASWSLIDPAKLKQMKAGPTIGDLTSYTKAEKGGQIKVVWNNQLQIPVSVVSSDGTSRRETMVQSTGAPSTKPWEKLQGYTFKDYSDYLD